MAKAKYTKIAVAEALKMLAGALKTVQVQEATPVKKMVDGVEKMVMETKMAPLAAKHVLSAKKYSNGAVTITTIDGKRYPEKVDLSTEDEEEEEAAA